MDRHGGSRARASAGRRPLLDGQDPVGDGRGRLRHRDQAKIKNVVLASRVDFVILVLVVADMVIKPGL
jgi:hypothetical protein